MTDPAPVAAAPASPTPAPAPAAAQPDILLELKQLCSGYGAVTAVDHVDMVMPKGTITCVMGRNGVGKTSLMRTIMGLNKTRSGSIRLAGTELATLQPHHRALAGVALVPQGRDIFPKLTVQENLLVGLEARPDRRRTVPDEVLSLFPILTSMARRLGGDLSGGQQQQLAIARALAGGPRVLLLDEPTEGIQPNIIQEIGAVLRRLVAGGLTVVLVEQYLDFVKEFGQRFYIMNRGKVVHQGLTSELHGDVVATHLSV
jgi:urea transport system ATP-binding protein